MSKSSEVADAKKDRAKLKKEAEHHKDVANERYAEKQDWAEVEQGNK